MSKFQLITKTLVKRRGAKAIGEAQDRRCWSNEETGSALGCCGNTIRNRLDTDDPGKQITVFELLRSVQSDGPHIANELLALVDHEAVAKSAAIDATCDRTKESRVLKAALALSVALADGLIEDEEIRDNRATIENARDALDALLSRVAPRSVA
jgi:hypothetical protein